MLDSMSIEELKRSIRDEVKQELINELVLKEKENHVSIVYKPLVPHKVFVVESQKILHENRINYTSPECRSALNYLIKNTLGIKTMPNLTKEQIPIALELTKDFAQLVKNAHKKYAHLFETKEDEFPQRDKSGLWVWGKN